MNPQITLELKQVRHVRELQRIEDHQYVRRIGLLYFQQMPGNKYLPRVITADTDGEWIIQKINLGQIYLTKEEVKAEAG